MQNKLPTWIVLGLLVVVVGLPFMFRRDRPGTGQSGETAMVLSVITPHGAQIREAFSHAYNEHRAEKNLPPVRFKWLVGGTSELVRKVSSQFEALALDNREEEGVDADLFWGGGEFDHNVSLAGGLSIERDGETFSLPLSIPFDISDADIATIYPNANIGGSPLYHKEKRWLGVALSSFGIVYNNDGLHQAQMAKPTVWDNLAEPSLYAKIALADPNHSGSITGAYEAVLRRKGWTDGWATLRRAFANTRYFAINSARVPMDVAQGEALMGMCIDFYGRYEVGAMPNDAPGGQPRLGYVDPVVHTEWGPKSLTVTNADPISLLRGAQHKDLANDFARWLLTPAAQRMWQLKAGEPGGPHNQDLRRQPVRRDVYADKAGWTDPDIDPFAFATPVPKGTPSYFSIVRGITRAMAIDNREALKEAWLALAATPESAPEHAKMLAAFDAMPAELTFVWPADLNDWQTVLLAPDHADSATLAAVDKVFKDFGGQLKSAYPRGQRDAKELAWAKFYKQQYGLVVSLGKQAAAREKALAD